MLRRSRPFGLFLLLMLVACTPAGANVTPSPTTSPPTNTPAPTDTPVPPNTPSPTADGGNSQPVIFFERSGGIAGDTVTYRTYRNGPLEKRPASLPGTVEAILLTPEEKARIPQLLAQLDALGFFTLTGDYMPEDTCCDRFFYTLTVSDAGRKNTITTVDATEGVPDAVWESIDLVQQFIRDVESN